LYQVAVPLLKRGATVTKPALELIATQQSMFSEPSMWK
jgi:hypothetical protein